MPLRAAHKPSPGDRGPQVAHLALDVIRRGNGLFDFLAKEIAELTAEPMNGYLYGAL